MKLITQCGGGSNRKIISWKKLQWKNKNKKYSQITGCLSDPKIALRSKIALRVPVQKGGELKIYGVFF